MMFNSSETLKASAENAFAVYLAERGDVACEYTYLKDECDFTDPEIFFAIENFEIRARAILEKADNTKPVGSLANAFEGLSFYMQTTDSYDSEEDWKDNIKDNVDEMLTLFEQLVK